MLSTTEALPPEDRTLSRRARREQRTLKVMIRMYCERHHAGPPGPARGRSPSEIRAEPGPCGECASLLAYACDRMERCRFGDDKPTCAQCPAHCFRPNMRERVRVVMRYSGPRMTMRHPYLAIRHLLDSRSAPSPS